MEKGRATATWPDLLLGILVALAAAGWAVFSPDSAARCGRELHQGILLPLVFSAAAAVALGIRGFRLPLLSFVLLAGAFLLPLWWRWVAGTSDTMLVGGLLPYSDASDYLLNAQRLAGGERFLGDANNRPMATAMLAVLWKIAHGDYRLVLALISVIGAAAAWIAAAEISLLLGTAAAAAWLFVDILFLRRFIGLPMTEHLGVLLGSLSVAFGCRAFRTGREGSWVLASLALALALCARAGPMLVLPALLVGAFLAWPHRQGGRWVLPGFMAVSMLAAFALNRLVALCVGSPDYLTNAVYIIHGLVYGGTWKDAMAQYGNDRQAVWHAVGAQVIAHPFALFLGGARSLYGFLRQCYMFSFVERRWLNAVLHLAFAAGGIAALSMLRRDRRAWWLLAPLIGLAASIPFLPPWDTDVMRIYAATIPLIALTVAVGVNASVSAMQKAAFSKVVQGNAFLSADAGGMHRGRLGNALLVFAILSCALLPPLLRLSVPAPGSSLEEAYASGTTAARFTYLPRAALRLASDSAQAGPAALSVGRFSGGLGDYASLYPAEAKLLASLPANCVLLPRDGRFSFVAIDANHATSAESGVIGNVRFRFITQGLLLLAADEALLARSPGLAAYRPADVGRFSFADNRYPVIRAGDTVTYADIMTSFDFARPFRRGQNINPSRPIVLDIHRLNFPVPGEYCVRLNHKHTLRLLVLPRNSAAPESNRAIADFVTSNCASLSAPAIRTGGQTSSDLERLVTSETPAPLSEDSIQELTALLQSTFNASTAP